MSVETCPLCGHDISKEFAEAISYPVKTSTAETPREIRFCPECGLGSAFPMPTKEALDQMYYNRGFWKLQDEDISIRKQPVPYAMARARWRLITSSIPHDAYQRGVRILDIGAGHGYLGDVAASDRKSVLAAYAMVEPDGRMRKGVDLRWRELDYPCDLELFERPSNVTGRYDLVVLSHILEHVVDPMTFMKEALDHIISGGYVFVDVPNRDDCFKKEVFPHVLFFSPQSIRELLERLSLEVIEIDTWGKSMERSPLNDTPPQIVRIRRFIVNKIIHQVPLGLSVPLVTTHFGFFTRNQKGTWIRALARKV